MNISSFFKQRTLQLEQEEIFDKQMKDLPCHEEVVRILFFLRQVNRQQTMEMSRISSYNIPALWSLLNSNLDEIANYHGILESVLLSDYPCYGMKNIMRTSSQPPLSPSSLSSVSSNI